MKSNLEKQRQNLMTACDSPAKLHAWLKMFLGLNVPTKSVCPGHCAPFEYMWSAYNEPARDLVVWAPRGGGKTRMAAAVTLLDLLHKPGIEVRILGGSLAQSGRMWDYFEEDVKRQAWELIDEQASARGKIVLKSGSKAAVLAQSQKAVRG